MYCTNCRINLPDNVKFCPNCGMATVPVLEVPADPVEAAPAADIQQPFETLQNAQPAYEPAAQPSYDPLLQVPQPLDPIMDEPQPTAPMYTPVPTVAPDPPAVYSDPSYDQGAYASSPVIPNEIISSIFTNGLLGTIFASTMFLSFLGIIFGVIARKKSNEMLRLYGYQTGKARAGRILGTVGLGLGIAMTVVFIFYVIYFVFMFAVIAGSGSW